MMSVFMEGIGVKRMERGTCHQTIHYSGQSLRCSHARPPAGGTVPTFAGHGLMVTLEFVFAFCAADHVVEGH